MQTEEGELTLGWTALATHDLIEEGSEAQAFQAPNLATEGSPGRFTLPSEEGKNRRI